MLAFFSSGSSEVAHIMLKELDWENDSYKWLGEKTHVGRILSGDVALPAAYQQFDIRPLLKKYLKRRRSSLSEYLFSGATPGTWNKPLSVDRIRNICKEHMKKSGIDVSKYKPHSIRHASASALIMAGATLDQVMALGRWKSLSTFLKYYLKQRPTINAAALLSGQTQTPGPLSADNVLAAHQARRGRNSTRYKGRGRPRTTDLPGRRRK